MTKKKLFAACLAAFTAAAISLLPMTGEAAEATAKQEAKADAKADTKDSAQTQNGYIYHSNQYGYTMLCPRRPLGVIPASALYEDQKGDILVFKNDGYTILHGWVILVDGFDGKAVPDLNKISEKDAKEYLEKLMHSSGYEGISLVNLTKDNKAIFGITAKEVEIDTNGDGTFDTVATAETQEAVAFFRTEKGRCFAVHLIDNPDLSDQALAAFQIGLCSLREADSKAVTK